MYSDYGITFDGLGSWRFGNDFAGNVIIFGVDNNSSSNTDNCKDNFLMKVKDPLVILMAVLVHQKKSLESILVR